MRKRLLSIALSAAIMITSAAGAGLAARASETAGEGMTAQEETEALSQEASDGATDETGGEELPLETEAGISPETETPLSPETEAALENADMGVTDITNGEDPEQVGDAAETLQMPEDSSAEDMNKSTINAAFDSTYQFDAEDAVVYVKEEAAVKTEPFDEAEDLLTLDKYFPIRLTGSNSLKYWEVRVDGEIGYIDSTVITRDSLEIEALKKEDIRREETEAQSRQEQEENIAEKTLEAKEDWEAALKDSRRAKLAGQTRSLYWDGPVLSRSKGAVYGPSGKETYYNLNMSGCVRNMNRRGYYYEVWVRNDGCKMFGDYIMCAANLGVHPFGSLVECSLGTCIVVDTGGFAAGNPHQLDIAVTW